MHIQILEEEGLVISRKEFTSRGVRTFIQITDKGRDVVKEYLELISNMKL